MKHLRPTSAYGRFLFAFCLLLCVEQAAAQTYIGRQKVDQFPTNTWGGKCYGLTWLPNDYNSNNDKYPLIIFLHGSGEAGTGIGGLWNLLSNALPQKIAQGWDPQAVNPNDGDTYKFIVVSPQAHEWSHNYAALPSILEEIQDKYRIDKNRIYITGLSAGGAGTWSAVTNGPNFAKKFAAVVPVSAAGTNTPQEATQLPLVGGTYGVKSWTICGTGDTFWQLATSFTNIINSATPAPDVPATATGIQNEAHTPGAWNTAYDPTWRSNVHGKNIYEWMLKYKRNNNGNNGGGNGGNQNPSAVAGNDMTITLPTNSVQLNGNGYDPDGTITHYSWFKVSGPSANIVSPSSVNTIVNNLNAGTYTFKLTVTDNVGASSTDEVKVTVNPAPVASFRPVPAKLEAETFNNMHGIQTENTSDAGGGQNLAYIDESDWFEYNINPASTGAYTVYFRLASANNGASFKVNKADGSTLATVTVPHTGGFQTWQTVPVNLNLSAGNQVLRIVSANNKTWNVNWIDFTPFVAPPPPPPSAALRHEAENWASMYGVRKENTSDAGGGQNVGYVDYGDWMEYNVVAPAAGTYTLKLRVATPSDDAKMEIRRNGNSVKTINLPKTNGYQNWSTITTTMELTAGQQTIRLVSARYNGWNINWLEFVAGGATPNSRKIEAENWVSMFGVQTEATSDVEGGLNVGWIDHSDWMNYNVTVPQSGTYKVKFRIATTNPNSQFKVLSSNGNVLRTVDVPKTNGWQNWKTITEDIYLVQGTQTIRLMSTGGGGFNINWLDVKSGDDDDDEDENDSRIATSGVTEEVAAEAVAASKAGLDIFPNPVQDRITLKVNNELTGTLSVQILDMTGAVKKQFNLSKASVGTIQNYLTIGDLQRGAYILKVQMNDWTQTIKIIKN
jgi:poly(3-hydroxybutyrate) depolymerase